MGAKITEVLSFCQKHMLLFPKDWDCPHCSAEASATGFGFAQIKQEGMALDRENANRNNDRASEQAG